MEEKQQYTSFNSESQKIEGIVNPVVIMEKAPKFYSNDQEKVLLNVLQKADRETEMHIKAMMWYHQDYNIKHYSVSFYPIDIKIENGLRVEIKREIEYHPPKRNGHRRNHAPSEIYKDIAFKLMAKDMIESDPMYKVTQIPLNKEYLKVKEELFGKFFPLPTDKLV